MGSNINAFAWTEDAVARLGSLWASGLSASLIGEQMGLSRSAVLGKAHRLALPPRRTVSRKAYANCVARKSKPHLAKSPKPRKPRERMVRIRPPVLKPEPFKFAGEAWEPLGPPISLLSLNDTVCRWPVGGTSTTAGTGFCGCAVAPGRVYCPEHFARSIGKGTPSEREAVRIAMSAVSTDNFQRVAEAA